MMIVYVIFKVICEGWVVFDSVVVQFKNFVVELFSKMGFRVGIKFMIDIVFKIIFIKFVNDVFVVLGEVVVGLEIVFFVQMNVEVKCLGMINIWFINLYGFFDNCQVIMVCDMVILVMVLCCDFLEFKDFYKYFGICFGKKIFWLVNCEFLLWVKGVDGMKMGYICNLGYNVVFLVMWWGWIFIGIIFGVLFGLECIVFVWNLFEEGF